MLTDYEKGKRDIQEWLAVSPARLIPWKIRVCVNNYPSDPNRQPYYDAMLYELWERRSARLLQWAKRGHYKGKDGIHD